MIQILKPSKKLNILFVGAEMDPFAGVGGLGSVMFSLPKALKKLGHDVRAFIPKYLQVENKDYDLEMEHENLHVPTDNEEGHQFLICNVKKHNGQGLNNQPVPTYFLENQEYYEQRSNVYGYADDMIRWALLCRGTLEFLAVSDWIPDLIICSDWQTGLLPNYLRTAYKNDTRLSRVACIFTIHNLSHQGMFNHNFVSEMDFDDGHSSIPAFNDSRILKINGMRRGLMYADFISTVSNTYAKEIMTTEYGEGLEELLRERRSVVSGILNGIDFDMWDPKKDTYLESNFSVNNLRARQKNKKFLQDRFGLPTNPDSFLLGMATRMSRQKGIDLLEPAMRPLLAELDMQLVIVGEGDSQLMTLLKDLQKDFPDKVAIHFKFDSILPHLIFAGVDATVVPSRFEPSGLTQMEAMHYGVVPIVRKTGGLADTVCDHSTGQEEANGFVFHNLDQNSLMIAIVRAYETYKSAQAQWRTLQRNAMNKDFSWDNSARRYEKLAFKAVEFRLDKLKKSTT